MKHREHKRNTPIVTLIRNYVNKKSGKVSVSREEIKRRFDYLDWKDQKKILAAFLDACISDREWAYTKLLDYWDASFEPKVRALWENYHEYRCSWSVIRFFPQDYLKEHLDEFSDERDYYFISLRLAKDMNYVIDRSKLSDIDYLALLYHTNRMITDDDARDTLFRVVHDSCLEDTFLPRLERLGEGKYPEVITPRNFREVNLAFYYILKLQQYEVLASFVHWNEAIEEAIYNSPEFNAIDKNNIRNDFEYEYLRTMVAKFYAFQALDDRYKLPSDPTVEQMLQNLNQGLERRTKQYEQDNRPLSEMSALECTDAEYDDEPFPF